MTGLDTVLVAASYYIFVCIQKGQIVHSIAYFIITIRAHLSYQSPVYVKLIIPQKGATRFETHHIRPGTFCHV